MKKILLMMLMVLLIPSITSANTGTNKWVLKRQAIAIQKAIKECPVKIPDIAWTVKYMTWDDNPKEKYQSWLYMVSQIQISIKDMKENKKCVISLGITERSNSIYWSELKKRLYDYRLKYINYLVKELWNTVGDMTRMLDNLSKDRVSYDTCVYNNKWTSCWDSPDKKIEKIKLKIEDIKFTINYLSKIKD